MTVSLRDLKKAVGAICSNTPVIDRYKGHIRFQHPCEQDSARVGMTLADMGSPTRQRLMISATLQDEDESGIDFQHLSLPTLHQICGSIHECYATYTTVMPEVQEDGSVDIYFYRAVSVSKAEIDDVIRGNRDTEFVISVRSLLTEVERASPMLRRYGSGQLSAEQLLSEHTGVAH